MTSTAISTALQMSSCQLKFHFKVYVLESKEQGAYENAASLRREKGTGPAAGNSAGLAGGWEDFAIGCRFGNDTCHSSGSWQGRTASAVHGGCSSTSCHRAHLPVGHHQPTHQCTGLCLGWHPVRSWRLLIRCQGTVTDLLFHILRALVHDGIQLQNERQQGPYRHFCQATKHWNWRQLLYDIQALKQITMTIYTCLHATQLRSRI